MSMLRKLTGSWLWRGTALLALLLVSFQTASAATNAAGTITLFAPGAPIGAPVGVQYQTPTGTWFDVTGWQATLIDKTKTDVPFRIWTVDQANFGQGPFRWVVYAMDGKTIWAISDIFNLPYGNGADVTMTIRPDNLATVAPKMAIKQAVSEAATVPVLASGSTVISEACPQCKSHAMITALLLGMPANSWIMVQYQDASGNWVPVQGWQGNAHKLFTQNTLKDWTPAGTGQLFQQWTVLPDNYGQGPFRWAVFDAPNGKLLAVSPNFTLPKVDFSNSIMYLTK